MARLYPPNIQGVIPAFYGTTLVVPFSMNKAVGEKEIGGFTVKIKTISGIVKITKDISVEDGVDFDNGIVTFSLTSEDATLQVGQFYKIQLAYISKVDNITGYYSTVGVAKYTTEPRVYIEGLESGANTHFYNYVGVYSQESLTGIEKKDATEKLYSSRFIVWDEKGEVYKDTGEVVHNTTSDINSFEATEQFSLLEDLEDEKIFSIQFQITTVNYLHINSPKYYIKQRKTIEPEEKVYIMAENDFVNGGIDLTLKGKGQSTLMGSFIISRANSKSNFLYWEKVFDFTLEGAIDPQKWHAKDFTCEQGVQYKYSIQQYNSNGVYSEKTYSDIVFSDFEDSFLYDGKKLLNIRFNPKVSSFKINLSENKQDTIGSQFPYFSRNGHVRYKEFPISGLISYLSDVDNLFNDIESLNTTDLISENISAERDFKLDVLNWLTDGKPKLFKSPGEGNYIVRLMNTSLSPSDPLNRMLHTFSCTAYELMEYSGANLFNYGLVGNLYLPDPIRASKTINLFSENPDNPNAIIFDPELGLNGYFQPLITTGVKSLAFVGVKPGTIVKIEDNQFCIGSTGSLYYDAGEESTIKNVSIWLDKDTDLTGTLSYTYGKITTGVFDIISSVKSKEVPIIQFFGNYYNQESIVDNNGNIAPSENIFDFLQDIRTSIVKTYMIRLQRRDSEELYIKPEDYEHFSNARDGGFVENGEIDFKEIVFYKDKFYNDIVPNIGYFTTNKFYPIRLGYTQEDINKESFTFEGYYIDRLDGGDNVCPYLDWAIDGLSLSYFKLNDNVYDVYIDTNNNPNIPKEKRNKVNIAERTAYEIPYPENYNYLSIGKAITAELSFVKMTTSYVLEDTIPELSQLRDEYVTLLENALSLNADYKYFLTEEENEVDQQLIKNYYLEYMNNAGNNGGKIESSEALRVAYYKYVSKLAEELTNYKERISKL